VRVVGKRTLHTLLGLKSQELISLEHEGVCEGVYEGVKAHESSKCKQ
jgi:hypothetical protein